MTSPLSKYSPLMLEAWRTATLENVKLPVGGRAEATTLRHALYRCRKDMKLAKHDLADMLDRVTISILEEPSPSGSPVWFVVMKPAETTFDNAFKAAGIKMPDAPDFD